MSAPVEHPLPAPASVGRSVLFASKAGPCIPTRLPAFEAALRTGGLPRGCLVEIFGAESTGKTSLALALAAAAQVAGGIAAYVDAEHSLDLRFARCLGVNIDELLVAHPADGEQALRLLVALLEARTVDLLVLDSLAAVLPSSADEASTEEMGNGRFNHLLWKLAALNARTQATVVLINQVRSRPAEGGGSSDVPTGGAAPKLLSAVRVELLTAPARQAGQEGIPLSLRVLKNRFRIPERQRVYTLHLPFNETGEPAFYARSVPLHLPEAP